MADYRCYFLSCNNSFMAVDVLRSDTDSDAIVQASMLIARRPQSAGFELWQGGRHVYKHLGSMTRRPPHRAAATEPPAAAACAPAAARAHGTAAPLTLSEARRIRAAASTEGPARAYRRMY